MKKIVLITFISLLIFTSISYSKVITLKDCYTDVKGYRSFDKNVYEDYKFVVDTNKNIVTLIYVWTDKEIKKQLEEVEIIIKKRKDSGQKYEHLESLRVMDKVNTGRFNINFIDTNYISTGKIVTDKVIIVDEAHNIRSSGNDKDENKRVYSALLEVCKDGINNRLIFLTATPMYNEPKDIYNLFYLLLLNDKREDLFNNDKIFDINNNINPSARDFIMMMSSL